MKKYLVRYKGKMEVISEKKAKKHPLYKNRKVKVPSETYSYVYVDNNSDGSLIYTTATTDDLDRRLIWQTDNSRSTLSWTILESTGFAITSYNTDTISSNNR